MRIPRFVRSSACGNQVTGQSNLRNTGNYTREEAIAAIDKEGTLPDVLSFDPSKPAKYPNGRVFTDDVIDYRIAFLTKNQCPPTGLKPHTDILKEFPYLGTPH